MTIRFEENVSPENAQFDANGPTPLANPFKNNGWDQ